MTKYPTPPYWKPVMPLASRLCIYRCSSIGLVTCCVWPLPGSQSRSSTGGHSTSSRRSHQQTQGQSEDQCKKPVELHHGISSMAANLTSHLGVHGVTSLLVTLKKGALSSLHWNHDRYKVDALVCDVCGRPCQSRIGLFTHKRSRRRHWWDQSYRWLNILIIFL